MTKATATNLAAIRSAYLEQVAVGLAPELRAGE